MKPGDTYTCEMCGGEFETTRSDEEAIAETIEIFGEHRADDAVICDDCFHEMMSTTARPN